MNFSNSYLQLGQDFYEKSLPTSVRDPKLLLWNHDLATQLMSTQELAQDANTLAQFFSGNKLLPGSDPVALAYAGHQFGNFVPQLGDGRAHLLGEVIDQSGLRWDIQLKGSGKTRFSRNGDGRCAIGPAVREYLMSESMAALGVPTSRCLAVVSTGESVVRETVRPGAVVTRLASSHIRIGTFQYFAARGDIKSIKALCDYTIHRHYPQLQQHQEGRYLKLVDAFMDKLIALVVAWMRVGFIHGVMNTDNTALSGETIDYGPCAMMGIYNPKTIYSSIDVMGRYAFGNQPDIAQWNLTRFAECLLPLIDDNSDRAVEQAKQVIETFSERFSKAYQLMLGHKLGLSVLQPSDHQLINNMIEQLRIERLDYTATFDQLTKSLSSDVISEQLKQSLGSHYDLWRQRLSQQQQSIEEIQLLMRNHNPVIIPRNHHVEAAIKESEQTGEVNKAQALLKVLRSPYQELAQTAQYQMPPDDGDKNYQTFCGT